MWCLHGCGRVLRPSWISLQFKQHCPLLRELQAATTLHTVRCNPHDACPHDACYVFATTKKQHVRTALHLCTYTAHTVLQALPERLLSSTAGSKAQLQALRCVVERRGAAAVLAARPALPAQLLQSTMQDRLGNSSANLLQQLLEKLHVECGAADDTGRPGRMRNACVCVVCCGDIWGVLQVYLHTYMCAVLVAVNVLVCDGVHVAVAHQHVPHRCSGVQHMDGGVAATHD